MQGWMSVYECVDGKEVGGRGVWQTLGGIGYFLCYFSSKKKWLVTMAEKMEAGNRNCFMDVITPPPIRSLSNGRLTTAQPTGTRHPNCECGCAALSRSKQRMEQEQCRH
jgi:hypothetical protein